jgi:transposase-like protein
MATTRPSENEPVGGVDYPRNWHEFLAFFSTEEQCLLYLARLRWPDGFRCRGCGHDRYWLRSDGRFLCCECRQKTSVTAGTLFEGTRIGLTSWFAAAWYVVNQTGGVSALGLQRVLGFGSYETAWAWLHKLRRAMVPTSGKLTGEVEVDESYVGGVEEGVRGRQTNTKTPIGIAVERHGPRGTAGRLRVRSLPNVGRDALMGFVQDAVEPGSTIVTDGWPTYKNVKHLGYTHIAHNISQSGKQAHELLPTCHRVSALLKRWLLGTHQGSVKPEHLDYYLDEFTFRFNRRYANHRGLLFYRLIQQAANTEPQPYTSLLGEAASKRRRRRQKAARRQPADRIKGEPVNVTQPRAKRPGGSKTRLDDEAVRRRYTQLAGRRGR